jgi:transglutaminase-like putative cysteine protease
MVKATSSDGAAAYSQLITIHAVAEKYGSLTYGGTVYQGKSTAGSSSPLTRSTATLSVTSPTTANFDADGFFTLKGTVTKSSVYNYAYVTVVKDSTLEKTTYFVRSDFAVRVWLRFGVGAYTIKVCEMGTFAPDLDGEGDYNNFTYSPSAIYTFHANNTRDESGIFLYPSDAVQSDDFRISNIASDLTFGLTDSQAKIKAVHDYVVKGLYYDDASLLDGHRKKQDALSTLDNATGVCEGYTSLTNALLRAAGIHAKCVSGTAGGAHAWTNVLVEGSWLFLDSTWDDPYPEGDYSIRYKYFLLTSLTGIDGDHTPLGERAERDVAIPAPSWRGRPNGWY